MNQEIRNTLEQLKNGEISVEEAMLSIKKQPFEELGYAKVDLHREVRQGAAEVIYGAGKTREQILAIAEKMLEQSIEPVLITRMSREAADYVMEALKGQKCKYEPLSGTCIVGQKPKPTGHGFIVVATGGTSDIPVAEEAALTAEAMGNEV